MKLFNGNDIKWGAYHLGYFAWDNKDANNPFNPETDEWYSWNRGWNLNFNGI